MSVELAGIGIAIGFSVGMLAGIALLRYLDGRRNDYYEEYKKRTKRERK